MLEPCGGCVAMLTSRASTRARTRVAERLIHFTYPQMTTGEIQPREVIGFVVLRHGRLDHRARIVEMRGGQIEPRERFVERTAGDDAALIQQYQMVGQPRHFIHRMADVEHGNLQLAMQALPDTAGSPACSPCRARRAVHPSAGCADW